MFKTLLARARQGHRTAAFPAQEPVAAAAVPRPARDRPGAASGGSPDRAEPCPTGAISVGDRAAARPRPLHLLRRLRRGRRGRVRFTRDWRLAAHGATT